MSRITIHYIDGQEEIFPETRASGGSYSTTYKMDGHFCVIENANGNKTIIPDHIIKKIEVSSTRW